MVPGDLLRPVVQYPVIVPQMLVVIARIRTNDVRVQRHRPVQQVPGFRAVVRCLIMVVQPVRAVVCAVFPVTPVTVQVDPIV